MLFSKHHPEMVTRADALAGRATPLSISGVHLLLGTSMVPPFPEGFELAYVAMGCFWGAERAFFELDGVHTTAVGYQGGFTPNPTYEEVCSGDTGHAEAVLVVFDPTLLSYEAVLATFFEGHDPTQGMRQGNDVGTQYRSAIYWTTPDQERIARATTAAYQARLDAKGLRPITTELAPAGPFYYAEEYHQQYLIKVPNGYCGLGGTGVSCPTGLDLGD